MILLPIIVQGVILLLFHLKKDPKLRETVQPTSKQQNRACLIPALEMQGQADFRKFEASQVIIESSRRPSKATKTDSVSKIKNKNKTNKSQGLVLSSSCLEHRIFSSYRTVQDATTEQGHLC